MGTQCQLALTISFDRHIPPSTPRFPPSAVHRLPGGLSRTRIDKSNVDTSPRAVCAGWVATPAVTGRVAGKPSLPAMRESAIFGSVPHDSHFGLTEVLFDSSSMECPNVLCENFGESRVAFRP